MPPLGLGSSGDPLPDAIPSSLDAEPLQCPRSPALPMCYAYDRDFSKQLSRKLELLLFSQQLRRNLYGIHVADDYPISHTPPEIKEKYLEDRRLALEELEAPTPDEEDMNLHQQSGPFEPIFEPPSPDTPTATCWRKTNAIPVKMGPKPFAQNLHTPPLSSEDEEVESVHLIPSVGLIPASPGPRSSKKRSFAQIADTPSSDEARRHRRRLLPSRRIPKGVP